MHAICTLCKCHIRDNNVLINILYVIYNLGRVNKIKFNQCKVIILRQVSSNNLN